MLDAKAITFLTVCQEKSYTKAAKKLHISQPAVSLQMKNLEDYYQVPLFSFEGKHFHLTQYGQLIYQSLLSIQNNEQYLMEHIESIKNKHHKINMGATLTVGEFMISDAISRYILKYPDADVAVIMNNTHVLLKKLDLGEIDFAVLEGNFPKNKYAYQTLMLCDYIAVCSEKLTEAQKIHSLKDLTDYRLIIREEGSGTRKIMEDYFEKEHINLSDFSYTTTLGCMNAIIELVKNHCGITFLYRAAVDDLLKKGTLKEIPLTNFPLQHEISIVWNKNNLQSTYLKKLIYELFDYI